MRYDWLFYFLPAAMFAGLMVFILFLFHTGSNTVDYAALCEAHGGRLLDRTYTSGRSTGHQYTCIRADMVIEY